MDTSRISVLNRSVLNETTYKCFRGALASIQTISSLHAFYTFVGLPSAFQQKQINELHSTLNREKLTAVVERNRVKLAEKAVAEKDQEVNELVTRLMQYERG